MARDNLVLRTFYVDSDIDDAMCVWVGGSGFSSELFRHWLAAGMSAAGREATRGFPRNDLQLPVLRTAWLDARVDSKLRIEAFHRGVEKNVVAMEYLRLGREVASPLKRIPSGLSQGPVSARDLTRQRVHETLAQMPDVGIDEDFSRSKGR